jgi:hypothetical protein
MVKFKRINIFVNRRFAKHQESIASHKIAAIFRSAVSPRGASPMRPVNYEQ